MDIHNNNLYQRLISDMNESYNNLETCTNKDYIPQRKRLCVWNLAQLGDYHYKKECYTEAIEYYAKARKMDCDEPSILNQMGLCFIKLGKIQRAISCFEEMTRRAGTDVQSSMDHRGEHKSLPWYNISICHFLEKRYHDAEKAIIKSIKLSPNDADSLSMLKDIKVKISTHAFLNFKHTLFKTDLLQSEKPQRNSENRTETKFKV